MVLSWAFELLTLKPNAQEDESEYRFLQNIEAEELDWSFSSENESLSVEDDIRELKDYSISNEAEIDVQLIEEERKWGNQGDVQDYSLEAEFYNY
ncbi:MAG: hypothetical protein AAFN00_09775 [Cyanobacteria bacterium J06558_2]